jgi:hypothetical protein
MKKILLISFILFLAFGLTACGKTSTQEFKTSVKRMARKGGRITQKDMANLQKYTNDIMQEQMKKMPKILEITKFLKSCLESTDDKFGAQECRKKVLNLSRKSGDVVAGVINETILKYWNKIGNWSYPEKREILVRLEKLIITETNMIKN